ncbi:hypothetical protein SAMN05192571_101137 [Pleomorphomonas diazotrophica]|uniref:hypothetical protein n=1 Tax=Pleomorphomonas diazotrophica TaxID=1166257 RepID=UPI0008EBA5FE|nr:hypothetical protein [Pleomorphomonas diazotrophica]SFM36121.1 hypothetical protein SAMN05192571_101137 [Pleomorphomonas diazotrophica]
MTALTKDRNTPRASGDIKSMLLAASALIFAGGIVMRNASGYAVKGQTALGLRGAGVAMLRVDNSDGSAGDLRIDVREGCFRFANSASTDEITIADIGNLAYVVDDQTVAKTSGGFTRSPAGFIRDVDDQGVVIEFCEDDLGAAIKNGKTYVSTRVATLVGSNVYRVVAPVAGRITKIWSVIEGALTTGDATLTAKIGATAVTDGVITVTQAGSAAGDVDSATPSAANVVAAGDGLSVTVGGTNATASAAVVTFEISTI